MFAGVLLLAVFVEFGVVAAFLVLGLGLDLREERAGEEEDYPQKTGAEHGVLGVDEGPGCEMRGIL